MAYTTLADLKAYMGHTVAADDTILTTLIATAQDIIDTYCRTTFEAAADTTRDFDYSNIDYGGDVLFTGNSYGTAASTTGYGSYIGTGISGGLGYRYRTRLWFDQPLFQITSVTMDGTAVPTDQYRLASRNDRPAFALLFTEFIASFDYEATIAITGRWGYSITPPATIVLATQRLTQYIFEKRRAAVRDTIGSDDFGGTVTVTRDIPMDVIYLIKPYRFNPIQS